MRWSKYWSFIFSIIPSKEHPGPISFRMDWLDLLAVQGTLKSLLQHHSSKASILQRSAFFTVQLSHPYMTTGKTIALTRRTFVGKVMSLLLNMLPRLVITFLPRSISPSNEYSRLIFFRIDWFHLLAVQGTLKSLLQPQLKSINSVLSFLYGPTLTFIHDHWKNHSFDYMDLCQQSDISAF